MTYNTEELNTLLNRLGSFIESDKSIRNKNVSLSLEVKQQLKRRIIRYTGMMYVFEHNVLENNVDTSLFNRIGVQPDTMNTIEKHKNIPYVFINRLPIEAKIKIQSINESAESLMKKKRKDNSPKIALIEGVSPYDSVTNLRVGLTDSGETTMAHLIPLGTYTIFWNLNIQYIPIHLRIILKQLMLSTMAWPAITEVTKDNRMFTRPNSDIPYIFISTLYAISTRYTKEICTILDIIIKNFYRTLISIKIISSIWNNSSKHGYTLNKLDLDFSKKIYTLYKVYIQTHNRIPDSIKKINIGLKNMKRHNTIPQNMFYIVSNYVNKKYKASYEEWMIDGDRYIVSNRLLSYTQTESDLLLHELTDVINKLMETFTLLNDRYKSTKVSNTYMKMNKPRQDSTMTTISEETTNTELYTYLKTNPYGRNIIINFLSKQVYYNESISINSFITYFKLYIKSKRIADSFIPALCKTLIHIIQLLTSKDTTHIIPSKIFIIFKSSDKRHINKPFNLYT
jgi:hypothetical protein